MNLTIISIGKVKNVSLKKEIDELKKRFTRLQTIELKECKAQTQVQIKDKEYNLFKPYLKKEGTHVLLTEFGKEYATKEFYDTFKSKSQPLYFYISGAFGPSEELKKEISNHLSLSKMVFTHEQAYYMLVEQLYRIECFEKNIPYTK